MDDIKPVTGIVGFFDILGYSSFLANNEPEYAIKVVKDVFHSFPSKIKKDFRELLKFGDSVTDANIDAWYSKIKWMLFADSIIVSMEIPETPDSNEKKFHWIIFELSASLLQGGMFIEGFPIRGGISFGSYIIDKENSCFAGKAIMNAHAQESILNLAAIAFDDSAIDEVRKLDCTTGCRYCTPTKRGFEFKHLLDTAYFFKLEQGLDLRQSMIGSFTRHNKELNEDALVKLNNTETFIRFCIAKAEEKGGVEIIGEKT